ncbi:hypothetical protein EV359DRAFT_84840 [Lentinula novae-zelandiae]|nr:hypothetical protein EV359DRAFT_84840 [Lentinula novae-zelandiae]
MCRFVPIKRARFCRWGPHFPNFLSPSKCQQAELSPPLLAPSPSQVAPTTLRRLRPIRQCRALPTSSVSWSSNWSGLKRRTGSYGKKKAEEAAKKKVEEEAARRAAAEEQQQQEAAEKRRRLAAAAAAQSRRGPPSSEATTSAHQVEVKVPHLVKKGKAPTRNEVSGGDPDNGDDGEDDDDKDEEKEPCEQCKAKKIPCLQQAGKRSSIICKPCHDSKVRCSYSNRPPTVKKEVTSNPTSERLAVLESQGTPRRSNPGQHIRLPHDEETGLVDEEGSPEEPIPGPLVLPKKRRRLVDSEEEREKEREQEEVRGDEEEDEDEPEPKKARSEKGKERED